MNQRWRCEWNEIIKRASDLDSAIGILKSDMLKLRGAIEDDNERRYNEALECDAQRECTAPPGFCPD